jgi:3',5'-nucleoside bisphosphate phosphatase
MFFADLHLHTHFSDGTYSPEELAAQGRRHGLSTLGLTDHDTTEGCARMAEACRALDIDFIPGTELTAQKDGNELHLLGYFIDPQNPVLLREMAKFQEARQNRIRKMVARLNEAGVPLEADSVFKLAQCRSPGRPHVARALVQGKFCATMDEAFERFMKKHRPAWVPKFKMSALQGIELIHQAGGLAVMAHPGLNRTDEIIPELVEAGLDGIECFHSKHSPVASARYLGIAERHGLLVTGGSDCHGMSKNKPLIGSVKLPLVYVEKLRAQAAERQSAFQPVAPPPAARLN